LSKGFGGTLQTIRGAGGCAPHPLPKGLRPSHPPGLIAICLFAPLLDGPDSALSPKQERKWIRQEAKGSQCAGKRGGDRATSNAQ